MSKNQIIPSDPVGSKQFRHRAKYLHALNVNGAAILGDHMEWVNILLIPEQLETYLMRDGNDLYFSFFSKYDNQNYDDILTLSYLTSGNNYTVYDIVNETDLGSFTATSVTQSFNVEFTPFTLRSDTVISISQITIL